MSSVKPSDAINDDDEPFEAKLSRNDVKKREMGLLQTRDYMFAQGKGISLSSLVKIQLGNSHQTAAGLRKLTMTRKSVKSASLVGFEPRMPQLPFAVGSREGGE